MPNGIANLISDFSSSASSEGLGIAILRRVRHSQEPEPVRAPSAEERQAELIKMLENQVRMEEREAARLRFEEALEEERQRHVEEMAAQRVIWVEQEALQLSSQIIKAAGNLESVLSEKVTRILAAVIPEALKQNAISEFTEILATILSGENTPLLKVTGPEDLLSSIKGSMMLREGLVEFVAADVVEVTLVAGDTMVETQFGAWTERLQALLKAE
jgi:hypothetical protein